MTEPTAAEQREAERHARGKEQLTAIRERLAKTEGPRNPFKRPKIVDPLKEKNDLELANR